MEILRLFRKGERVVGQGHEDDPQVRKRLGKFGQRVNQAERRRKFWNTVLESLRFAETPWDMGPPPLPTAPDEEEKKWRSLTIIYEHPLGFKK